MNLVVGGSPTLAVPSSNGNNHIPPSAVSNTIYKEETVSTDVTAEAVAAVV